MTTYTATYSPDDNKLRLTASQRLDAATYARVKAAGFAWAPKQEQFIAPMWTPGRADLCIELAGQIDDDDSNLSARAEERAERFEGYEEKRASESARALDYVHRIADGIPMGQPILVGHHSERHARKDAERIENGMRRAVQLFDTAEYWKRRAAAAIAHADYKERPDVRHRRIKGIEADQRKVQKASDETARYLKLWQTAIDGGAGWKTHTSDGTPTTPHSRCLTVASLDHVSACFTLEKYPRQAPASTYEGMQSLYSALSDGTCTPEQARDIAVRVHERNQAHRARWLEHYANRLAYERAMLGESGGIVADKFELQPGGTITHRGRRSVILRVNKRDGAALSVTVTGQSWTVGVEEITSYEPPSETAAAAVAAVMKKAPICNYAGRGFVAVTKAQWDEIASEYKGTRDMGAGVDVTNGGARFDSLADYRAGSEAYTRHRVRVAVGYQLRRLIGPDAWAAVLAANTSMHCKDSNTAHGIHPVYITDAKTAEPARVDAPPKAPRKSLARKVAEAAGVDTGNAPADAPAASTALALTVAKVEARAVLAELTQQAPRATYSAPPPTQSAAEIETLRQALKTGVQVVSAPQLFPTPPDLAARMVDEANVQAGHRVLEPSAGTGRILAALPCLRPGGSVTAVEINQALAAALVEVADTTHCADFLAIDGPAAHVACMSANAAPLGRFDRILMNPPFANGADVAHVSHALQFLAPGGRLVAIMSAGVSFRSDRKTAEFRANLERMGGTIEALPAGTFEASGTGVNTVLVVVDAPETEQAPPPPAECEAAPPPVQSSTLAAPVAPQPEWVAEIVHNQLRKRYEWADGRPTRDVFEREAQKLEEGATRLTADGNHQTAANYRAAAAIVRAEPVPPDMVRGGEGNLYPHRLYKCLAVFLEADPDPANAYMEQHPGACVLKVEGGRVYIAHRDDQGTEGAALLEAECEPPAGYVWKDFSSPTGYKWRAPVYDPEHAREAAAKARAA